MSRLPVKLIIIILAIFTFARCESVKPYQRVYLNDSEMKMGQPGARGFEENMQAYREGAAGGGSKKTSGGCGCN
jgi:hypothetical protein